MDLEIGNRYAARPLGAIESIERTPLRRYTPRSGGTEQEVNGVRQHRFVPLRGKAVIISPTLCGMLIALVPCLHAIAQSDKPSNRAFLTSKRAVCGRDARVLVDR
jgi:hypothetical protein